MEYLVVWKIEIKADNPYEAAKEVEALLRENSIKWYFEVTNRESGITTEIDMEREDS